MTKQAYKTLIHDLKGEGVELICALDNVHSIELLYVGNKCLVLPHNRNARHDKSRFYQATRNLYKTADTIEKIRLLQEARDFYDCNASIRKGLL